MNKLEKIIKEVEDKKEEMNKWFESLSEIQLRFVIETLWNNATYEFKKHIFKEYN